MEFPEPQRALFKAIMDCMGEAHTYTELADIIERLDFYGYKLTKNETPEVSPWRKFEGTVDCYPYLLKHRKHPKNVMLYIENEDVLKHHIDNSNISDGGFYFMHIPPIPKDK